MKLKIMLVAISVVTLNLGGCVRKQDLQGASATQTPVPLSELISVLNTPSSSSRELTRAMFALEKWGISATIAVPSLVPLLEHEDPDVRATAIHTLGTMGSAAKCALPLLAERLWDPIGFVRTASASAIDYVSGVDLVESYAKLDPSKSGWVYDEPEGSITGRAREWWTSEGQYTDWDSSSTPCKE